MCRRGEAPDVGRRGGRAETERLQDGPHPWRSLVSPPVLIDDLPRLEAVSHNELRRHSRLPDRRRAWRMLDIADRGADRRPSRGPGCQGRPGTLRRRRRQRQCRLDAPGRSPPRASEHRFQKYGKPPDPKIGVGDTITVTIWEAAAGGLFGPSPSTGVSPGSRSVTIPDQVVARDGAISVPFADRIPVAGRSPLEIQHTIEQRLAEKAIEPQVIVVITKSVTNAATVSGEVVSGARVPLSVNGDRLLDLIALAGGAKAPVYETFVRLSRNGVTATIPMETLVSDPAENIYAWPGDVLTLVRVPQTFSVFGATGQNTQVTFNAEKVTLAEALAKAGGLQDLRADPAGVFLFRFEPPGCRRRPQGAPLGNWARRQFARRLPPRSQRRQCLFFCPALSCRRQGRHLRRQRQAERAAEVLHLIEHAHGTRDHRHRRDEGGTLTRSLLFDAAERQSARRERRPALYHRECGSCPQFRIFPATI